MGLRLFIVAGGLMAAAIVAVEVTGRVAFGLGDPPLIIRDPEIEYLFAPSRCYRRLGNRLCFNEWSMRSEPGDQFDVMVLGDSVISGGAQTDQDELATTILGELSGLRVANVSAGSWGPANQLAYVRRFGWFDADHAIIVVSAHDLSDVPTFAEDLGADFPEAPPPFAVWEAAERYAPRYLPWRRTNSGAAVAAQSKSDLREIGEQAFRDLVSTAVAEVPNACVNYHRERSETKPPAAKTVFRAVAEKANVPFVTLREVASDFRDDIHIDIAGQRHLADVMLSCIQNSGV